jgi:hypothetical protein
LNSFQPYYDKRRIRKEMLQGFLVDVLADDILYIPIKLRASSNCKAESTNVIRGAGEHGEPAGEVVKASFRILPPRYCSGERVQF